MGTLVGPTYNLSSGSSLEIDMPKGSWPWVVLFNYSTASIIVNSPGGTRNLGPFVADVFGINPGQPLKLTVPVSLSPAGAFLGQIQTTFYSKSEGQPVGYPFPLPIFGSSPIAMAVDAIIPWVVGSGEAQVTYSTDGSYSQASLLPLKFQTPPGTTAVVVSFSILGVQGINPTGATGTIGLLLEGINSGAFTDAETIITFPYTPTSGANPPVKYPYNVVLPLGSVSDTTWELWSSYDVSYGGVVIPPVQSEAILSIYAIGS